MYFVQPVRIILNITFYIYKFNKNNNNNIYNEWFVYSCHLNPSVQITYINHIVLTKKFY